MTQNDDPTVERRMSRWWPPRREATRIFVALIAVGTLLIVIRGYYLEILIDSPLTVLGAATVVTAIVVLIRVGQHYEWTGFRERRTLWDWLDLLVVPLVLAGIGIGFAMQQDARQQAIEQQRAYDTALQGYLDQMSTLVLEDLSDPKVRTLMRARTLTVLERLNPSRKTQVMRFLSEAHLVSPYPTEESPIISLNGSGSDPEATGADLSGADLSRLPLLAEVQLAGADLSDANLEGSGCFSAELWRANLQNAILRGTALANANLNATNLQDAKLDKAHLNDANLSGANLSGADLSGADLSGADLSGAEGITNEELDQQAESLEGATMPNGQKYEDWLKSRGRAEDGENE